MTLKLTVTLSEPVTTWPALPRPTVHLHNEDEAPLRWINRDRVRCQCRLELTDVTTGVVHAWDDPVPGGQDPVERSLNGGARATDELRLAALQPLRGAGRFELRASASFAGGDVLSEPAPFEVLAGPAAALDHAPMGGSPGGNELCGWVETTAGGARLWLSTFTAMYTPRFVVSEPVADVVPGIWPVLSVSARRTAVRPHVAWVDGRGLQWAASEDPGYTTGSIACEPSWNLVVPLCENPFDGTNPPDADAVLVAPTDGGWSLCVTRLGSGVMGTRTELRGAPPAWATTVVHANDRRDTFTLHPSIEGGTATLLLYRFGWSAGQTPNAATHAGAVPGNFIAATMRPTLDDAVTGIVASWIAGTRARYVLHRIRFAGADGAARVEQMVELPVPLGVVVSRAQVYVAEAGQMHALLQIGAPKAAPRWTLWSEGRGLVALPDGLAGAPGPISLFFLHGTRPAVVWADPAVGLRLAPVDPPAVPLSLG